MTGPPPTAPGARRRTTWLDRAVAAILVAVVGFVMGQQFLTPNKRVIPVIAAVLLFGLAWRADMATAIGLLLIALPYPRYTTFGNTNLAFVLLLLVIWLLRATTGQTRPQNRTPADVPLVALFVCYVVSFYNAQPTELSQNLQLFAVMVACWLMFAMIAANLRTPGDLKRVLAFQAISALTVCLFALYEVTHPGTTVVQTLFQSSHTLTAGQSSLTALRVGSVFLDYEILCEYCALNFLLVVFLFLRSASLMGRLAYGGLALFLAFVLFTTVTRGGLISLGVGILYLAWQVRRRLSFVGVVITLATIIGGAFAMNAYVATATQSGNLFERLFASQVKGLMPDTRSVVWPAAWERIFEHPLIGHGPFYSHVSGGHVYYWPHCLYLFVGFNVGFIGLGVLVWLLVSLFRMTRSGTDDLRNGDYVSSFLLMARAQMVVFLVDEAKIEYLRNTVYQFQVWVMFGLIAAAARMLQESRAAQSATTRGRVPAGRP